MVTKYVLAYARCYLSCFERFVRFINKGAYTQIAMTGKNFLPACWDSFNLMLRNAARFTITAGLGDLVVFLG